MNVPTRSRHIPVRPDWLALRPEAALEPDRRIIDAHHHLWDRPGSHYERAEMEDDVRASGHKIVASVFVECGANLTDDPDPARRSLGETAYVTQMARASAADPDRAAYVALGMVGNVPLIEGARVGEILDEHVALSEGRFRGVRNTSAFHPNPEAHGSDLSPPAGLLAAPSFRAGLAALAQRGLVFDAWMYHTQLAELADLARAVPEASIVMNHIGGPIGIGPYAGQRAEVFAAWRDAIAPIAALANVRVKLGGMGMRLFGFPFHEAPLPPSSEELAAAWGPYLTTLIDMFGPSRCMFESNFPVDKGTAAYGTIWNAFKRVAAPYSPAEKDRLFFGTAAETYGLAVPQDAGAGAPKVGTHG